MFELKLVLLFMINSRYTIMFYVSANSWAQLRFIRFSLIHFFVLCQSKEQKMAQNTKWPSHIEVLEVSDLVEWKLNIWAVHRKNSTLDQRKPAPFCVRGVLRHFLSTDLMESSNLYQQIQAHNDFKILNQFWKRFIRGGKTRFCKNFSKLVWREG